MPTSSLSASETRDLPPPHTWTYGWARLRAMERREVVDRSRQALAKRWDVLRHHLALGFDHVPLRAVQCRPRFFFQPEDLPELISLVRRHCPREVEATIERARDICRHRFNLLGYANLDYGPQLDWHFDPVHGKRAAQRPWYQIPFLDFYQVGDSKIIWELNRDQHLVTLAKAFRFTPACRGYGSCISCPAVPTSPATSVPACCAPLPSMHATLSAISRPTSPPTPI